MMTFHLFIYLFIFVDAVKSKASSLQPKSSEVRLPVFNL